jgi:hypothetical protein
MIYMAANILALILAMLILVYCEDKMERVKYMSDTYLKFEGFKKLAVFAVLANLLAVTVNMIILATGESMKDGELGCIRSPSHYHPATCAKCNCK